MPRRRFEHEFKIEAVRLIGERGVSVAQASRDLEVHENVRRKWVKEFAADPGQAAHGGRVPCGIGKMTGGLAQGLRLLPSHHDRRTIER